MPEQNAKQVFPFPLDPLMYIGRVRRDPDSGNVKHIEVFYDTDMIHLEDGDEFITFHTQVMLEGDS
jgi:ribosomal protein S4E